MTYYSALHYAAKAEAAATTATALLPYLTDITTVATNIASVNTVSADISSITTAATNISSINTVASNIFDISTVATDIANINAVAADLTNIDNASTYAAEAKQWAIGDPSEPVDGSAKYWAQQAAGQVIPSQTGHSGEYLTTDGTALSWDSVDALPSQTGQSGKFLTTDGTDASWATLTIPSVDIDGISINRNTDDELQTIGVINQNDTTTAIKTWTGTKAQYDAIVIKDANTLYNITDDTDVSLTILEALYPVGSIYITTNDACPLSTLIAGSTWVLVSSGIVQAGDIPCKGNGMTLGLTNGTYEKGMVYGYYSSSYYGMVPNGDTLGKSVGTSGNTQTDGLATSWGITTDETKSGIIADTSSLTLAVNIFERTA